MYRSADESGATVLPRGKIGELAEAVDIFFDRFSSLLPHYVPRSPALKISLLVAFIVLIVGLKPVIQDKNDNAKSPNAVKQFRWIIMLGVLIAVCAQLQEFIADKVYMATNIKLNHQHFANVWWLSKYSHAIKH
jgi:hypothetical protein